jgi:outer membrane immunogenic protein
MAGPSWSWTGFYLGLAVGARENDAKWTTLELPGGSLPSADNEALFDRTGFRYGGYAGYDYQVERLVLGVQASIGNASGAGHTAVGIPGMFQTPPGFANADSSTVKTGWDGSVVARIGYLVAPNALLYAVGGVAVQRVTLSAVCNVFFTGECFNSNHDESFSQTLTAATFGGGIETMIAPNWRARFDYRYANFGDIRHTFFLDETFQSPTVNVAVRTHTASFGLAYQLGPATVVAKY